MTSAFAIRSSANLQRWHTFVVVANAGSISRAAEILASDASMFSRQIHALELECGLRLFQRHGHGVVLTEAGAVVLSEARRLLSHAEDFDRFLEEQLRQPVGSIAIGSLESMASLVIHHVVADLRSQYPKIRFTFLEGPSAQVQEWLSKGRIDSGVCTAMATASRWARRR